VFDAYPDGAGEVEVRCRLDDHAKFMIEILDTGIPFDVLSVPKPDINASISDRKIGGIFYQKIGG